MAFIGFDLDETLGRFSALHNHILFLTPGAVYQNLLLEESPFVPSEELRGKLSNGLNEFAKCLVSKDSELGILRPGILKIIKRLSDAKDRGQIRAISIYSNNGNLGLLLVAAAMIENALGKPGLFCNHVDWYSPMRANERTPDSPGMAIKTARVLRETFIDPRCGTVESAANIPFEQLYFFDDTSHPNLRGIIGENHYFQVKPYKRDTTNFPVIDDCFQTALEASGLASDPKYLEYVTPIAKALEGDGELIESIYGVIRMRNQVDFKPTVLPFVDDTDALIARIDILFPLPDYGANYFPVVEGGRRKKTKRRQKVARKYKKASKTRHRKPRKN
jgi:hypothetical protein